MSKQPLLIGHELIKVKVKKVKKKNTTSPRPAVDKVKQVVDASQWRYDFTVYVNKECESSDFGYINKASQFPTFETLQDLLLDDTVRICPAVLSSKTHLYLSLVATIVAFAPKELIGPTDLDEHAWAKVEREINRLISEKPKWSLTLSLHVNYTTIAKESGVSKPASEGITKGNKKMVQLKLSGYWFK